jgi:hypothetical protein
MISTWGDQPGHKTALMLHTQLISAVVHGLPPLLDEPTRVSYCAILPSQDPARFRYMDNGCIEVTVNEEKTKSKSGSSLSLTFPPVGNNVNRQRLIIEQYGNVLYINGTFGKAIPVRVDPHLTGDGASEHVINVASICSTKLNWNSKFSDSLDAAKVLGWTLKSMRPAMHLATKSELTLPAVWKWIEAKFLSDVDFLGAIVLFALPQTREAAEGFLQVIAPPGSAEWKPWIDLYNLVMRKF